MAIAEDLAASVELAYLADLLKPALRVGDFALTGLLAQTRTALVFTARDRNAADVVLKVTGTAYAPMLAHELAVLRECAEADVPGVVRALCVELTWMSLPGDRLAAALVLPYLSGGDLNSVAERAARAGQLGAPLALAAAMQIANALRGMLCELPRPFVHGDLRPSNVLLPSASAELARLTLVDVDQAHPPERDESDVAAFGGLLRLLAGGRTRDRRFDRFVDRCVGNHYASMADPELWRDLNGFSSRG